MVRVWDRHPLYGNWTLYTRRRKSIFPGRRIEWKLYYGDGLITFGYAESRWGAEREAANARARLVRDGLTRR